MLCKYRSLKSAVDLARAIDILENHRMFLSSITALNDPLEGLNLKPVINGYAGMGIMTNSELLPLPTSNTLQKFGALCLSANCRNPQMWVHYADGFKGLCVCVRESGPFSQAHQVEYVEEALDARGAMIAAFDMPIEEQTQRALLIKQSGWSYEQEYRILRLLEADKGECQEADEAPHLFSFELEDISAVILGHCAEKEVAGLIVRTCERLGIPLYETLIRQMSARVDIVPFGFKRSCDGSTLDEQECRYCELTNQRSFSEIELE